MPETLAVCFVYIVAHVVFLLRQKRDPGSPSDFGEPEEFSFSISRECMREKVFFFHGNRHTFSRGPLMSSNGNLIPDGLGSAMVARPRGDSVESFLTA